MTAIVLRSVYVFAFLLVMAVAPGRAFAQAAFTADADFASEDAAGCVETEVFVFARRGGSAPSIADVKIFERDNCNDEEVLTAHGRAKLKGNELRFDSRSRTANLDTTIEMVDERSNERFDVVADLTWKTSAPAVSAIHDTDMEEPGKIVRRERPIKKTFNEAKSYGTISRGEHNFIPKRATDAGIVLLSE
jgi:hypothetical protein